MYRRVWVAVIFKKGRARSKNLHPPARQGGVPLVDKRLSRVQHHSAGLLFSRTVNTPNTSEGKRLKAVSAQSGAFSCVLSNGYRALVGLLHSACSHLTKNASRCEKGAAEN